MPRATRFTDRVPQSRHSNSICQSFPVLCRQPTGSIKPPQSAARSPGRMSTCLDRRQNGQWLRYPPLVSATTRASQLRQRNPVFSLRRLTRSPANRRKDFDPRCSGVRFVLTRRHEDGRPPGLAGQGLDSPLERAITSSSDFTTTITVVRSGPRPVLLVVPATVTRISQVPLVGVGPRLTGDASTPVIGEPRSPCACSSWNGRDEPPETRRAEERCPRDYFMRTPCQPDSSTSTALFGRFGDAA